MHAADLRKPGCRIHAEGDLMLRGMKRCRCCLWHRYQPNGTVIDCTIPEARLLECCSNTGSTTVGRKGSGCDIVTVVVGDSRLLLRCMQSFGGCWESKVGGRASGTTRSAQRPLVWCTGTGWHLPQPLCAARPATAHGDDLVVATTTAATLRKTLRVLQQTLCTSL